MKVRNTLLILAMATSLSLFGVACNTADDTDTTAENDTYGGTAEPGTTGTTGTTDPYGTTGTTGSPAAPGTVMVSDDQIEEQISQQFENDPTLKDVDVDAEDGTVTLSGTVKTKEDLARAEQMVRQMSGVTNVKIDTVEVDTTHEID